MLKAIAEIMDPIKPWQRVASGRAPLFFGAAVNFWQLVIVVLAIRGVGWLLSFVP